MNYSSIQTLTGHTSKVTSIVATPHGGILSLSLDGTLRLYVRCAKPQTKPLDAVVSATRFFLFECKAVLGDTKCWLTSAVLQKAISPFGNWTAYVSTSEGDIVLYRSASTSGTTHDTSHPPVAKHKTWARVHALEITHMLLIPCLSFLVTLCGDASSRILDSSQGLPFFSVRNAGRSRYTSVEWLSSEGHILYGDEAGGVELLSVSREKVVARLLLVPGCTALSRIRGLSLRLPLIGQLSAHKLRNAALALLPKSAEIVLYDFRISESCVDMLGHSTEVVSIRTCPKESAGSASSTRHQRISREEMCMFSVESRGVIRCWDDYDSTFRFEMTEKIASEVTCMEVVWMLNCVVTAHDDGTLLMWSLSTGTNLHSGVLRGGVITALVVAAPKATAATLLAADSQGRVAQVDLIGTDHKRAAGELSVDRVFQGYHENTAEHGCGIRALAFLGSASCFVSGGDDCSLRIWRSNSNGAAHKVSGHTSSVTSVFCFDTHIISGDAGGCVRLWRVSPCSSRDIGVVLEPLHAWPPLLPSVQELDSSLQPLRAILSCALAESSIWMSQSSPTSDTTSLWKISLDDGGLSELVTLATELAHSSHSICSAHLSMLDPRLPLCGSRLFLGTTSGVILKYAI